ncbi:hypothetical protein A6F57_03735 [Alteromonas stellipolaris]|uniref:exosortase n=2 Tax=Alteromonas stellipolaris TaxID=233316 RepID=UPI0007B434B9|nr:exosortase [Alteromonas stellipolaris]ANB21736.1 hypothetical protein A6K25_10890 [Alteromonas stellipolaris]ANB24400.1 hypothetical protein A6F57_03735 [Alteromonas stellipolaris]
MLARNSLIAFITMAMVILSWALLNYPVMKTLWDNGFDDGTYSHAYLIPAIILYLIYTAAEQEKLIFRAKINYGWLAAGIIVGVLFWISVWSQISLLYWSLSLSLLILLSLQIFRLSWSLIFPLSYLIFIYPFWGAFAGFFQELSVFMVTFIMSFTDIPVFVENEYVTIPAGVFEIARGCSGLRYIIVSLAISSLYVFLYLRTFKSAFIFIVFAIAGALVTNWLRIVFLILIGDYTNMESSLMTDHNNFGWYIYVPVALIQFYLGGKLEQADERNRLSNPTTKVAAEEVAGNFPLKITGAIAIVMTLCFSSYAAQTSIHNTIVLPENCESNSEKLHDINLAVENYSFVCSDSSVGNNEQSRVFYFNGEELDNKATFYLNTVIPTDHTSLSKEVSDRTIQVVSRDKLGGYWLIKYTYEIEGQQFSSVRSFKLARIKSALNGVNAHRLAVTITKCSGDCSLLSSTSALSSSYAGS